MPLDPSHYEVVLETPRLRLLRVTYASHEGSPMHEHPAGVRVFLTDVLTRFTFADGSIQDSPRADGEVIWAEAVRHANENRRQERVEILELELRGLPDRRARPTANRAPAGTYEQVVVDNEFVRVVRRRVPPGQSAPGRPAPERVVIAMSDHAEGPPGRAARRWRRGEAKLVSAGSGTMRNAGETWLEQVVIELKTAEADAVER